MPEVHEGDGDRAEMQHRRQAGGGYPVIGIGNVTSCGLSESRIKRFTVAILISQISILLTRLQGETVQAVRSSCTQTYAPWTVDSGIPPMLHQKTGGKCAVLVTGG